MRKGYILIFGLIAIISLSLPVSAANPRVLITKPDDGATGVPINVGEISIFFSEPMDTKTWSILQIIDHEFPPVMSMEPPWKDEQTFILKLGKLKPGTKYGLQLNSGTKKGFKSAKGTALTPMPIRFETTGQTGGEDTGGGQD
ncbi:MAG: Ig-like domain-containing protein, partial [Desulfobacterales bacterium]